MLEADNEFRHTAGLPQLDLPEHLWTVRNMDTSPRQGATLPGDIFGS